MTKRKQTLRVDPVPPPEVRVLTLVSIPAGAGLRVSCCSTKIWGCWTHWNPLTKRTVRCTKPVELCAGHLAGMPQRWKGALTVCGDNQRPYLVDLTRGGALYLLTQANDGDFRGKLIHFQREGNHKRTPLIPTIVGQVEHPDKLPMEQDPEATLMKIWGISDI